MRSRSVLAMIEAAAIAEVDAVALVEPVLRHLDARHGARVDEHVLRPPRQRLDRAAHREQPA